MQFQYYVLVNKVYLKSTDAASSQVKITQT